jgi:pimeloyl-ACP methyl ester carboxylesterase
VRDAVRGLLLGGDNPETAALAPKVRKLIDAGVMTDAGGQIAATVYGFGGTALLDRQLDLLLDGRSMLWWSMARFASMTIRPAPYRNEVDLVNNIAFRELDYAPEPDGLPLDPAVAIREIVTHTAAFEAEPYDLVAEMPKFDWPTVVISGGRDLVTPSAVAERIASLVSNAMLLTLPTMAHSALDFREPAALAIAGAVWRGEHARLADQAGALDSLPARPALRLLWKAVDVAATAEAALPLLRRADAKSP